MLYGNTKNPKACIVLNCPEPQGDEGFSVFAGPKGETLLKALDNPDDYCYTYLVPTALVEDGLSDNPVSRKPYDAEVEKYLPRLIETLAALPCEVIIPLGATLLKCLVGEGEYITQAVGKKYKRVYGAKAFKVVPNFDPGMVYKRSGIDGEFKAVFENQGQEELKAEWVILSPGDGIYELKRLLKLFNKGEISYTIFDTETTSLEPHTGKLIMFSWCHDADRRGFSLPLVVNNTIPEKEVFADFKFAETDAYTEGSLSSKQWTEEDPYKIPKVLGCEATPEQTRAILDLTKQILENVPIVGHNLKFDVKYTHYHGVADLRKMKIQDDTMLMGFQVLGKKNISGWLSLKGMAQRYCGADNWDGIVDDFLSRYRRNDEKHFGNLPTGILGRYAALDGYWNRELYKYLRRVLKKEMVWVTRLVTDMIRPFAEAEVKGVAVDQEVRKTLETAYTTLRDTTEVDIKKLPKVSVYRQMDYDKLYAKKAAELKKSKPNPEKIWAEVFKLGNDDKVRDLMYGEAFYNLPVLPDYMTDGGKSGIARPQTGKDARNHFIEEMLNDKVLEELKDQLDPYDLETLREARTFLEKLNQHSRMEKLLSTYLGESVDQQCEGNLLKPDFNLIGTLGGRLSSGFHTIDSWSDIKRIYTSRWRGKGGVICAPDFSQLELRIAASVSGDPGLIKAYVDKVDIHIMTASKVFGVPINQVVKTQRAVGKTINFAILYGKTAHGLALELGIDQTLAQKYIDDFFEGFPFLRDHFEKATKWITTEGCIYTAMGRRIPIDDWDSKNKGKLNAAIRSGNNATIQSPASDCVLWTIRETYEALVREAYRSFMVASVHDSIELDVYPGEFFKVLKTIKTKAEADLPAALDWIKCPIELGFEMGVQWGSAVEFGIDEITDDHFKGHGKGLRRDIVALIEELSLAYDVSYSVKKEEEKSYKPSDIAYVIRDDKTWEIDLEIKPKVA